MLHVEPLHGVRQREVPEPEHVVPAPQRDMHSAPFGLLQFECSYEGMLRVP